MLSGVGMTDIAVGRALWNDPVRQVAVRTLDRDTPFPADFRSIATARQIEASTSLGDEVAGTRVRLTATMTDLDTLQPGSRQHVLTHS